MPCRILRCRPKPALWGSFLVGLLAEPANTSFLDRVSGWQRGSQGQIDERNHGQRCECRSGEMHSMHLNLDTNSTSTHCPSLRLLRDGFNASQHTEYATNQQRGTSFFSHPLLPRPGGMTTEPQSHINTKTTRTLPVNPLALLLRLPKLSSSEQPTLFSFRLFPTQVAVLAADGQTNVSEVQTMQERTRGMTCMPRPESSRESSPSQVQRYLPTWPGTRPLCCWLAGWQLAGYAIIIRGPVGSPQQEGCWRPHQQWTPLEHVR